jgi:hypothetical protein
LNKELYINEKYISGKLISFNNWKIDCEDKKLIDYDGHGYLLDKDLNVVFDNVYPSQYLKYKDEKDIEYYFYET